MQLISLYVILRCKHSVQKNPPQIQELEPSNNDSLYHKYLIKRNSDSDSQDSCIYKR